MREEREADQAREAIEKLYQSFKSGFLSILFFILCVYTIFFGIFGFHNPDPRHCFYYFGVDTPSRDPNGLEYLAM